MTRTDKKTIPDILHDRLYLINRMTLKAYGLWPYQSRRVRMTIVSVISLCVLSVVVPEVIFFMEKIREKDMGKIVDCIPNLILTYVAYVLLFNCVLNFDKMKKTLFKIKSDWNQLQNMDEKKIFYEYTKFGFILHSIFLIATCCTLVFFCLEPLIPFALDFVFPLNESRPVKTMLEVQYFVDVKKYYLPIYLHNLQAAYFVIFSILTFDFYFIMVVQHSCSMFATLGFKIGNIMNKKIDNFHPEYVQGRIISDRIKECIRYHWDCIDFAELIENTLTVAWILQLLFNMVIISFLGVQTITRTNELLTLLKYAMTVNTIIVRLFYVCWMGQRMLNHSDEVYDYLSNVPWYDLPHDSKRLLLLMMLRSTSPCQISAGKMIYLNFMTYCTLMKTSGSYFTMILSTQ